MEDKNLKVFVCIGLPGSGKTTWTEEKLRQNPDMVRVSRDEFRIMFRNSGVTEPKIEEMINGMQEKAIAAALKRKLNVIVDNCHVKSSHIKPIIKLCEYMADVEFVLFDCSAKKCIERDKARGNKVGENYILKLDEQFKILKDTFDFSRRPKKPFYMRPKFEIKENGLPKAVVFDIDGTLAHMGNRGPYDMEKVDMDDLNPFVAEQVAFHRNAGRQIIIVSGRDESSRELTEFWLDFHGVKFDKLIMRQNDDSRRDSVVKREIYENEIKDKYNVLCVYDDRIQVLDVWHKLGVFTFNVNQSNIEF